MTAPLTVAYFSMEVGLEPDLPTYSGGLGVLAGDTLRGAADLGVPMVAVTLVHRKGYFHQHLDTKGTQSETPAEWSPESRLEPMPQRVGVTIEGRTVLVRAWRYLVRGLLGVVPVYLLDTNLEENSEWDRRLTDTLYGGDLHYRLCQEVVLGVGGVEFLHAAGHDSVTTYHMNEGHAALLILGLLEEFAGGQVPQEVSEEAREVIRHRCVFTTHTPIPAGHDQFPAELVRGVLGEPAASLLLACDGCLDGILNMTGLALTFSRYVNGVGMRHEEISRGIFPGYPINSITNGIHALTWAAEPFRELYDRHFPEWRRDNLYLRYVINVPPGEIAVAHEACKRQLLAEVDQRTGVKLDPSALTLGFARRAAAYKRADLLFTDPDRLRRFAHTAGPLQIVFAGKAHPRDEGGKAQIRRVFEAAANLKADVRVVYLEEYDIALARLLCAGADVWLNTPLKPQEASGTSGMKAAVNGVPSLSILDGWWVEGCLEGLTGWAIGEDGGKPGDPEREAASLYDKLEHVIVPLFYDRPLAFAEVMRSTIALNGSYYNAQRMVAQYVRNAYAISAEECEGRSGREVPGIRSVSSAASCPAA
ncbi:MAG: alpha-glucan family phosphorylase [Planctomycetia bacterium]|nr:alpha-glucan family phosphorylase [Planctomycetia bacterium]